MYIYIYAIYMVYMDHVFLYGIYMLYIYMVYMDHMFWYGIHATYVYMVYMDHMFLYGIYAIGGGGVDRRGTDPYMYMYDSYNMLWLGING